MLFHLSVQEGLSDKMTSEYIREMLKWGILPRNIWIKCSRQGSYWYKGLGVFNGVFEKLQGSGCEHSDG